jgi:predicted alpha/beta hydrolase family esterase
MHIQAQCFDFLFLPGRGGSGVNHWQTHWLGALPNASRLVQDNWETPDPIDWIRRLDAAVVAAPRRVVLVAHSLSTIVAAKWAAGALPEHLGKVAAAFLVATTDVENPDPSFDVVRPFAPVPLQPLPFPTMVVASRDDTRVSFARAEEFATAWAAEFQDVGKLGHMGNDERLGGWSDGLLLLGRLLGKAGL